MPPCLFIRISSPVRDLFWERESIQRAVMQQTGRCLLYLSESLAHLKRSSDCVILTGPGLCPFLLRIDLKLPAKMDFTRAASPRTRAARGSSAHACWGLSVTLASLQRDGPKQRFIMEQVHFLFEGLTNGAGRSGPLALFVCKTLHRLLLWGKWPRRPLLKSGKNEG